MATLDICLVFVFFQLLGKLSAEIHPASVTFLHHPTGDGRWRFLVTDGRFLLESESDGKEMTDCEMRMPRKEDISNINGSPDVLRKYMDDKAIQSMVEHCLFVKATKRAKSKRDDNQSATPFDPEETGQPSGGGLGVGIFPGTKWCGLGNDAATYDDLGTHKATDACCREHDHCPYFIDHFETKYNYENPYPWTLSHCDCDTKLYNCLKQANTTASDEVGKLFFGLLDVHCFTFKKGQYCSQRHWAGLFCEKKAYGERAVTQTFPHKWNDDGDNVFG